TPAFAWQHGRPVLIGLVGGTTPTGPATATAALRFASSLLGQHPSGPPQHLLWATGYFPRSVPESNTSVYAYRPYATPPAATTHTPRMATSLPIAPLHGS